MRPILLAIADFFDEFPVLVFILFLVAISNCGSGCANVDKAEQAAIAYGQKMWPSQTVIVDCDTYDSDGNGKVRCSINHDGNIVAMECPSSWMPQFSSKCVPLKHGLFW